LRARVLSKPKSAHAKTPVRDIVKLVCLFGIPAVVIGGSLWFRRLNALPPLLLPKVVMPSPNAHDILIEAGKVASGNPRDWDVEKSKLTIAQKKQLVAENQKVFRTIRKALVQDFQQPITYSILQSFPEYDQYRNLAQLMALASQTEAESGDYNKASQYATDAITMGLKIPKGSGLLGYLVGASCEGMGNASLWKIADKLDTKTLRTTIQKIEKSDDLRISTAETLTVEKHYTAYLFHFVSANAGGFFSQMQGSGNGSEQSGTGTNPWHILFLPKCPAYEANQRFMDENIALARKPYYRNAVLPEVPNDPINQLIVPVFIGVRTKEAQIKTQSALLRTYLALRLYKLERAIYPEHLEGLVKYGYLAKAPVDAYGADRPLGYKNVSDSFTLYSVGPDGKDDNGTPISPNYTSIGVEPGQKKKIDKPRRYVEEGDTGDMVARINTY
jgi:hypothetical protein